MRSSFRIRSLYIVIFRKESKPRLTSIESANKQLATIEKIISMIEKKDYYEISVFLKQTITDVKTVCGLV